VSDLERVLGEAGLHGARGDFARAEEAFAHVIEHGDERLRARAELERAYLRQVSDRRGVERFAETAAAPMRTLERLGDHEGLARAWKAIARAEAVLGRADRQREACRRSREQSARAGLEPDPYVIYLEGLALLSGSAPLAEAIAHAEGDAGLQVRALGRAMQERFQEARELASRREELIAEAGRPPTPLPAEVELLAGDPVAAESFARRAFDAQAAAGDVGHGGGTAVVLARTLLEQDRLDEVEKILRWIDEHAVGSDRGVEIARRGIEARVRAARGDAAAAEQLAREAIALADETEWLGARAEARLDLAAVLGTPEPAREALALYERKGDVAGARRARSIANY
jgi:hypothetical protein